MKKRLAQDDGFTLIELLVVIGIFSVVSVSFYQIVFSSTRSSDKTISIIDVSEEARLGLNRMIRDTREAAQLVSAGPTEFEILINFDTDSELGEEPPASTGYERMRFTLSGGSILAGPPGRQELLVDGIGCIAADCTANPVFDYASNRLEWDWNANGVTTWQEVDDATTARGIAAVGDGDGVLDAGEVQELNVVVFNFLVHSGDSSSEFDAQAVMRNSR